MHDTSLSAYRIVSERRPALWRRVLDYIREHPGCTQVDISRELGESARKRISELIGPRVGDVYASGVVRIGRLEYTTYAVRVPDVCEQLTLWQA